VTVGDFWEQSMAAPVCPLGSPNRPLPPARSGDRCRLPAPVDIGPICGSYICWAKRPNGLRPCLKKKRPRACGFIFLSGACLAHLRQKIDGTTPTNSMTNTHKQDFCFYFSLFNQYLRNESDQNFFSFFF
jgi:hypothetical protein